MSTLKLSWKEIRNLELTYIMLTKVHSDLSVSQETMQRLLSMLGSSGLEYQKLLVYSDVTKLMRRELCKTSLIVSLNSKDLSQLLSLETQDGVTLQVLTDVEFSAPQST